MLLLVTACTTTPTEPGVTIQHKGTVTEELLLQYIGGSIHYYDGFGGPIMMETSSVLDSASTRSVSVPASGSANTYTQTNVQVASIDEGDIFKTDGNFIYTATDQKLFIISAQKENSEIITTIDTEFFINGMFIEDNILLVYGNNHYGRFYQFQTSQIHIYDVSDASNPVLLESFIAEGRITQARLFKGGAYLIAQSTPTIGRPVPMFTTESQIQTRIAPADVQIIGEPQRAQYVTIYTINLQTQNVAHHPFLTDYIQTVYMSENALYLASQSYLSEWELFRELLPQYIRLSNEEKRIIQLIEETSPLVLSKQEKEMKIMQVYERHVMALPSDEQDILETQIEKAIKERLKEIESMTLTTITKVPISDNLIATSVTTIPGRLVNQFAMDEYRDVLRVATTLPRDWYLDIESENRVYTFDSNLRQLDVVKNIAPGESIFSARYVQDRLYMVTFEEIDPFFVIDLSNPRNIQILGELKITGFSRYLHPIDENTILGFGQQATERGQITGLKISLFDVTDVNNPIEKATFEGSDRFAFSSALYEHKAFLYDPVTQTLVLPVQHNDWQNTDNSYAGAYVFTANENEVTLRGLIDHLQGNDVWSSMVERSSIINDSIYTKSRNLLRVHDVFTLNAQTNIQLNMKSDFEDIIFDERENVISISPTN